MEKQTLYIQNPNANRVIINDLSLDFGPFMAMSLNEEDPTSVKQSGDLRTLLASGALVRITQQEYELATERQIKIQEDSLQKSLDRRLNERANNTGNAEEPDYIAVDQRGGNQNQSINFVGRAEDNESYQLAFRNYRLASINSGSYADPQEFYNKANSDPNFILGWLQKNSAPVINANIPVPVNATSDGFVNGMNSLGYVPTNLQNPADAVIDIIED